MLTNIHPADFDAQIRGVILGSEGNKNRPYFDRPQNISGSKVSIGYGFILEGRDILRLVLFDLIILSGMIAQAI